MVYKYNTLFECLNNMWKEHEVEEADIYGSIYGECSATYCGADVVTITDFGHEHYKNMLDCPCELDVENGYIDVDFGDDEGLETDLEDFLSCAAGYCPLSEYNKLFNDGGN